MSIDRMRVAAVDLLIEKGFTFRDGKWVEPGHNPFVSPQPALSYSDAVDGALRYDTVFFTEFKNFCGDVDKDPDDPPNWSAGKWTHYGTRMITMVVDAVRRSKP